MLRKAYGGAGGTYHILPLPSPILPRMCHPWAVASLDVWNSELPSVSMLGVLPCSRAHRQHLDLSDVPEGFPEVHVQVLDDTFKLSPTQLWVYGESATSEEGTGSYTWGSGGVSRSPDGDQAALLG